MARLVLAAAVVADQLLLALVTVASFRSALAIPADDLLVAPVAVALGVVALTTVAVNHSVPVGVRRRLALVAAAIVHDTVAFTFIAVITRDAVVSVASDLLLVPLPLPAMAPGNSCSPRLGGLVANRAVGDSRRARRDGDDLGAGNNLAGSGWVTSSALIDRQKPICWDVITRTQARSVEATTALTHVTRADDVTLSLINPEVTSVKSLAAEAVTTVSLV